MSKNSPLTLIRSRRSRHIRITVYPDATVKVSAPFSATNQRIMSFLAEKSGWIRRKVDYFKTHTVPEGNSLLRTKNRREYLAKKEEARALVARKLEGFNAHYGFTYHSVAIRDQKSRWGSCSQKGNLNFNYKIIFLAPELQDYLIVHELCHLKELNHSKRFWDLVAETVPQYKELRRKLRGLG
jgi:predicted metal-dependent hydrolase